MARKGITILLAAVLGALCAPLSAQAESSFVLTFFVHDFDDPLRTEFMMNETPPHSEQPTSQSCFHRCPTNGPRTYTFRAQNPFAQAVELPRDGQGEFEFWMRAAVVGPTAVPAGTTRVSFHLLRDDGVTLGFGNTVTRNVMGTTPIQFRGDYFLQNFNIPRNGSVIWKVRIEGDNNDYNDAAGPYGVSTAYPFRVTIPLMAPPGTSLLWLKSMEHPADLVRTGTVAAYNIEIGNNGSWEKVVRVEAEPGPPVYMEPPASPLNFIEAGLSRVWTLNVTPLQSGIHRLVLWFNETYDAETKARVEVPIRAGVEGTGRAWRGCIDAAPEAGKSTPAFSDAPSTTTSAVFVCKLNATTPGSRLVWRADILNGFAYVRLIDFADGRETYQARLPTFSDGDFTVPIEGERILEVRHQAAGLMQFDVEGPPISSPVATDSALSSNEGTDNVMPAPKAVAQRNWLLIAGAAVLLGALGSWSLSRRFGP